MENPCINCKNEGVGHIDRRTLMDIAHKFYTITLGNGRVITVCGQHLDRTDIFKVQKIENSRFVFYPNGKR